MDEPKISDIPSIQALLTQTQAYVELTTLANKLKPFSSVFKALGVDLDKIGEARDKAEELAKTAQELGQVADQFNDHFSKLGWVISSTMKLSVAREAIQLADAGKIAEAEALLVNAYTPDLINLWLMQMKRIKAFQPRLRLALLALQDYKEGRYHACIPVVLALMDGFVNELNNGRGFFADATDLEAWDSIAAHKKGLVALSGIFKQGRNKTRTEQITLPYRNGIMHGNDLGYDNQIVAAKAWAALLALKDWAELAEKGQLSEPSTKPSFSWSHLMDQVQQTKELKQKLVAWTPRQITVGQDVPETGEIREYPEGSPEQKLVEFLMYWKKKNYGLMASCVPTLRNISRKSMPKKVREAFENLELTEFRILEIEDKAAATTEIHISLKYLRYGQATSKEYKFQLSYVDEMRKPHVRGQAGYSWKIDNWRYLY